MIEKQKKFLAFTLFLLTLLVILINVLPQKDGVFELFGSWVIVGLRVVIVIGALAFFLIGPIVLGLLGRKRLIRAIDPAMELGPIIITCLLCALVVGAAWMVLIYPAVSIENWLAGPLSWPVVAAPSNPTAPMSFGLYSLAFFLFGWAILGNW